MATHLDKTPFASPASQLPSPSPKSLKRRGVDPLDEDEKAQLAFRMCHPVGPLLHYWGGSKLNEWKASILLAGNASEVAPELVLNGTPQQSTLLEQIDHTRFWRYSISLKKELRSSIHTYSVAEKRFSFELPGYNASWNVATYAGSGSADREKGSVAEALWESHCQKPFHLAAALGGHVCADGLFELESLKEWLGIKNAEKRLTAPFTPEMEQEVLDYFVDRYCQQLTRSGIDKLLASVAHVSLLGERDVISVYDNLPESVQRCAVIRGVSDVAHRVYLLFQHQTTQNKLPEKVYVGNTSSFIKQLSRVCLVGIDLPLEPHSRQELDQLYQRFQSISKKTKHLVVLLSSPLFYPPIPGLTQLKGTDLESVLPGWVQEYVGNTEQFKQLTLNVKEPLQLRWPGSDAQRSEVLELIGRLQKIGESKNCSITLLAGGAPAGTLGVLKNGVGDIWQVALSPLSGLPIVNDLVSALIKGSLEQQSFNDTKAGILEWKSSNGGPNFRLLSRHGWGQFEESDNLADLKVSLMAKIEDRLSSYRGLKPTYQYTHRVEPFRHFEEIRLEESQELAPPARCGNKCALV